MISLFIKVIDLKNRFSNGLIGLCNSNAAFLSSAIISAHRKNRYLHDITINEDL